MNTLAAQSRVATVGLAGRKRVNLVKVARAQRILVLVVLASLFLYAARFAITMTPPMGQSGVIAFFIILALGHLAVWIAAIVCTVRLSIATGGNIVLAILGGLLMILPLIGLILMVIVNMRATGILKRHGAKVGFLGVPPSEMERLLQGNCPGCGYSLEGLTSNTCPECGLQTA